MSLPFEETQTAFLPELSTDASDVNHLVCCRDSWASTFCGMSTENEPINLVSDFVCAMCMEEATRQYGGPLDEGICPIDRTPCPDESEIDDRISRASLDHPPDKAVPA